MTHRLLLPSKDSALDSSFFGLVLNTWSPPSIKRFSFELFLLWTRPAAYSLEQEDKERRATQDPGQANQSEANTQPNEAPGRQRTKMTTRQGSGPSSSRDSAVKVDNTSEI